MCLLVAKMSTEHLAVIYVCAVKSSLFDYATQPVC